jgi:hypothetical protein
VKGVSIAGVVIGSVAVGVVVSLELIRGSHLWLPSPSALVADASVDEGGVRTEVPEALERHAGARLDRARADELRERIRARLGDAGSATPPLGQDFVTRGMREDVLPLANACYGRARKQAPDLTGKVELHYRLIAARGIGAVVDEARLLAGTTLSDSEFRTCLLDSMMALTLDAPPEDGVIAVTYPIRFEPEDRPD